MNKKKLPSNERRALMERGPIVNFIRNLHDGNYAKAQASLKQAIDVKIAHKMMNAYNTDLFKK